MWNWLVVDARKQNVLHLCKVTAIELQVNTMLSSIDCLFRGGRPRQFQFLKKSHQWWNVRNVLIPEHCVLNKKRRTRHGSPLDSHPGDDDDEEWTVWDSCTGWREICTLIDLLLHMYRRDIAGEQGEDPSTAEWSFFICHHNNNHWFIGTYGRRTSAFNYTLEGIYGHSSVLLHLILSLLLVLYHLGACEGI